jgi:hypothetical protein
MEASRPLVSQLASKEKTVLIGKGIASPLFITRKGEANVLVLDDPLGSLRITAQGAALVELAPSVPLTRYQISVEMAHDKAYSDQAEVGVYSCYSAVETETRRHFFFTQVRYADTGAVSRAGFRFDRPELSRAALSAVDFVVDKTGRDVPHNFSSWTGPQVFFLPAPSAWRSFAVEVRANDSLGLDWDHCDVVSANRVLPALEVRGYLSDVRKHDQGLPPDFDWAWQGPLGIYIHSSSVRIKTLCVTPLE